MSLARLEGLGVTYPGASAPALDGLTLQIEAGERLAVIGESGSGKTTLARALAGLLPQGSRVTGRIDWQRDTSPRPGSGYGYVFQDPGASLNPVLTVGSQLVEVVRTHSRISRARARAQARALLERVRIPDPAGALGRYPHQFSGGQRQRIAIALAIAGNPYLLIADEATSALDTLVQADIAALLDDLVREAGLTLVFVTHDMALARQLADRIAVLHEARLQEVGPVAQVIGTPRAPYTRHLLAQYLDLDSPPMIGRPGIGLTGV